MLSPIEARLQALTEELEPVREAAEKLVDKTSKFDSSGETLLISHRPAIGTEAYAIVLYAGSPENLTADYEQTHSKRLTTKFVIPEAYRAFPQVLNGAEIYQMSLYGLPASMARNPPLLNRSARQPLDLATANTNWKIRYKPDASQFYFGGSPYSDDENLAYFLNPDGSVEAHRVGGKVFGTWTSLGNLLAQEILRAESLFDAYETSMRELYRKIEMSGKPRKLKKK